MVYIPIHASGVLVLFVPVEFCNTKCMLYLE
jgi:hypothetical protein